VIKYYKTVNNVLVCLESFENGSWINMTNPTDEEINLVSSIAGIDPEFIRPALDEEERSRIESENGQTMVLVDIPFVESSTSGGGIVYSTIPLGITFSKDVIITVCLKESAILDDFIKNNVKSFCTQFKSRFLLQILFRNATLYLHYLRQIDKLSSKFEAELQKSMRNKEVSLLLQLEKSLVYFSTSLKSNESVLEKLLRMDAVKKFEEDQDLLEDVIIENKQAIEMTNIYSSILSGTMDAFTSIISNNLNIVMKSLTIITISLAVPTMISGFFGMNVPNLWNNSPIAFPIIVAGSAVLAIATSLLLVKKRLF